MTLNGVHWQLLGKLETWKERAQVCFNDNFNLNVGANGTNVGAFLSHLSRIVDNLYYLSSSRVCRGLECQDPWQTRADIIPRDRANLVHLCSLDFSYRSSYVYAAEGQAQFRERNCTVVPFKGRESMYPMFTSPTVNR